MTPQTAPASQTPPKTSGLAIGALILSCIPCLCIWVAGVIMGIVALGQIKARPNEIGGRGVAIAAIVVGCTWGLIATVGILAAIAIPNFVSYQARAKQSECKTSLKTAYIAEQVYLSEHKSFATNGEAIGFVAPPNARYQYFFGDQKERVPEQLPAGLRAELGVQGSCPDCSITIACVGNVDGDEALDVWSISTLERGDTPAGIPRHDIDDVDADR
jgi:type II secretory pathway pseudopilin PulG